MRPHASELGHNSGALCALSDDPAKSSVVLDRELDQEKSLDPSGPRIRCLLCGWSPARTTAGLVPVATSGTRSIREECARRASTTGLRHSAFMYPLVATFRLVCAAMKSRVTASGYTQD